MKSVIDYFSSSIWTIISFILIIFLILIPFGSFLSYSFFTVDGLDINHEFSLANYKEFFIDEIYINTFIEKLTKEMLKGYKGTTKQKCKGNAKVFFRKIQSKM